MYSKMNELQACTRPRQQPGLLFPFPGLFQTDSPAL